MRSNEPQIQLDTRYLSDLRRFGLELQKWTVQDTYNTPSHYFSEQPLRKDGQVNSTNTVPCISWSDDTLGLFISNLVEIEGVFIEAEVKKQIFSFGFNLKTTRESNYTVGDELFSSSGFGLKTIYLPEGSNFKISSKGHYQSITLLIDLDNLFKKLEMDLGDFPTIVRESLESPRGNVLRHKFCSNTRKIVEDILRFEANNAHLSPLYYQAKSYELAATLLELFQSEDDLCWDHVRIPEKEIQRLELVREEIEASITQVGNIEALTKTAAMNRTKLRSLFKKVYGVTISQYRTTLVMDKAAKLLQQSDTSIAEIAYTLGYADASAFIVAFKRFYGYSPSVLRTG